MKKFIKISIAFMMIFTSSFINAQSPIVCTCTNGDFESGSFTNWQGQTGWCCPVQQI